MLELAGQNPLCATFECPICKKKLTVHEGTDADFALFPFVEIHKNGKGYIHYYPCQIQTKCDGTSAIPFKHTVQISAYVECPESVVKELQ